MNMRLRKKHSGFGVMGWIVMIPVLIIVILILTVGFYEGRKAYWDNKVREMCEKDGGVTVYEKIPVTNEQFQKMDKIEGSISIPPESLLKPETPAFRVTSEKLIKKPEPKIIRFEELIKRREDGETIGKIVSYSRIGGDFPTIIGHPTYFRCPDPKELYANQSKFFIVKQGD